MKTLGIIKPDAVRRNLIGSILAMIEKKGFSIVKIKSLKMSKKMASQFYSVHKGKEFYSSLIEYITSDTIVAFVLEGENVVEEYRKIMGGTDPKAAKKNTIRGKYGVSIGENTVHGSDSFKNAKQEIKVMGF